MRDVPTTVTSNREPVAMKNNHRPPHVLARPLCALMLLVGAGVIASPAQANVPIPRLQWSEHLASSTRPAEPAPAPAPAGITLRMEEDAGESLINEIVLAKGHELLGTDYVYGADSDDAVDCSSLVQRMFASAGIETPRTARELARSGHAVRNHQFVPGDLLFYRWGRAGLHVAVYLPGDRILHASTSRREVVVSSLNKTWARRMVGARRLIRADLS
jgi:cell wall-associated NlpC family hydrolase